MKKNFRGGKLAITVLTIASITLSFFSLGTNTAQAAIAEVSHDALGAVTINPATGFPFWYEDVSGGGGDRLQPCLGTNPDGTGPKDPNCLLPADATYDGVSPIVFPANFPSEFSYYTATARILNVGPAGSGRVDFTATLGGTFAGGTPLAGDQTTFLKIGLGAFGNGELSPNSTYSVTHPFALPFSFTTDDLGAVAAFRRQDGGVASGDFTSLLPAANTGFSRFINVISPVPGYVGNISATQALEGGGILTITGPNIGGPGVSTVSTNLFTVSGKIAPNNPPVIDLIPAQTGTQNTALSFTVAATDADFDQITFSIVSRSNLANENDATINPTTGLFSWTPNAGGIFNFTLGASDRKITVASSVTVTVSALPILTAILVAPANATILVGATRQFTATVMDQFNDPIIPLPVVEWRTADGNIAEINRDTGLASGVSSGTVTITARSGGISGNATLNVIVAPVCQTTADEDLSGTINNLEILNHVRSWKSGAVPNAEILNAIRFWKAGSGC